MKDNSLERNCRNCYFGDFQECRRGESGELLWDGEKGQYDEYNFCSGWERADSDRRRTEEGERKWKN